MKITATKTLMKSAPEIWELIDDELQLRHWSESLCGADGPIEVVTREPEQLIGWRCDGERSVKMKVKLEEKGFGTRVTFAAKSDEQLREEVLDQFLEDLAEPQKRPFSAV
jgi:hypothetical protein